MKGCNAVMYLRLSKEETGGGILNESNSISNQREMIRHFLEKHPEITLVNEFSDDGKSGVDFNRPGFLRMMEGLKKGEADCVIVKDLSRFGRNYIDAGIYLERVFPWMGIRFIAVSDGYDSEHAKAGDDLLLPFKNLMNDAYARDASLKVRSTLAAKRANGDFVNAFAGYGFRKSKDDRHMLEVEEETAEVIRFLARCLIEGISAVGIAKRLNAMGILTPYGWKKAKKSTYVTAFQKREDFLWSAGMVRRIAGEESSSGWLILGKTKSLGYKVKKRYPSSPEEITRIKKENLKILTDGEFQILQRALSLDTRAAPGEEKIGKYSGIICCGGCGQSMVRRSVKRREKVYRYYICAANKKDKNLCSSHMISKERLEKALQTVTEKQFGLTDRKKNPKEKHRFSGKVLEKQLQKKREDREKYGSLSAAACGDFRDGLLTACEYRILTEEIADGIQSCEKAEKEILREQHRWEKEQGLTRGLILWLFEKVEVMGSREIHISFCFRPPFKS